MYMRKLVLAIAALLASTAISNAVIIRDLGVDPTSSGGAFANSVGGTTFSDQYTFSLDHTMTLTIASVTNVFPTPSDFIANFSAEVVSGTPLMPGSVVLGPDAAVQGCGMITLCQTIAGSAVLAAGAYFLDITGTGGGTAGYGGNIATFAVPGPIVGAGLPGLLAAFGFGGWQWKRRRRTA
jgi:hypothetical protein